MTPDLATHTGAWPPAGSGRISTVETCHLVTLPQIRDPRGALTFIESGAHIPFPIRGVCWIYDVPGGAASGGCAHWTREEFVVALSGSFDVVLDDAQSSTRVRLDRAFTGLYVSPGIWRRLENFSTNAVCLTLASLPYREDDEARDYDLYRRMQRARIPL